MSDEGLFLDALNPSSPDQLVNDLRQVGASAVGLYVLRRDASGNLLGNGDWTPGHVQAVLAAGFHVLPIVVPGSRPQDSDPQSAIDTALAFGCPVGPIVVDLETFSFPSAGWVGGFIQTVRAQGWKALRYGDVTALAGYPVGDGDWISHGYIPVRSDQLFPVPALPQVAGVVGDQYTVGVILNGTSYDGSVFDLNIFGGVDDMALTPEQDQRLADVLYMLLYGAAPRFADSASNPMGWQVPGGKGHLTRAFEQSFANQAAILADLGVDQSEIDTVLAKIQTPAPVDPVALANALEPLLAPHLSTGLDPQVVAKDVALELGKALSAAP